MSDEKYEVTTPNAAIIPYDSSSLFFDVARFEHAQRVAKVFADSTMVPQHFQGNIGNCVIALNLAERMLCDPFMLMQNMYIVHGRPGIEGKLVIALINQSGKFTPLQFRHENKKTDKWICTAYATHKGTQEKIEKAIDWALVVAEGWDKDKGQQRSKWRTMPEQMFEYRSATFFARTYCPEVILGMRSADELPDMNPVTLRKTANGTYTDQEPEVSDKPPVELYKAKNESAKDDQPSDDSPSGPFEERTEDELKSPTWNPYESEIQARYGDEKRTIILKECGEKNIDTHKKLPKELHKLLIDSATVTPTAEPLGQPTFLTAEYMKDPESGELYPAWKNLKDAYENLGGEVYTKALEAKRLDACITTENAIIVASAMKSIAEAEQF